MKTIRLKSGILIFVIVFLFLSEVTAGGEKPPWLKNRPVKSDYYTGIGMAQKNNQTQDFHQIARDNALQDLSSEITVQISSDFTVELFENSGIVREDVKSQIQTTTQANLEGYELVDSWENEQEYWVYYELSRAKYRMGRHHRLQKAADLGSDFFAQAQAKLLLGDPAAAIALNTQALIAIEEFIAEPIQVEQAGKTIFLQNEIYSELQSVLNRIQIKPEAPKIKATLGRALKNPVMVNVSFDADKPVQNLPVHFEFVKGTGELLSLVQSDHSGRAASIISGIQSAEKLQIIMAEVDLNHGVSDSMNVITSSILNKLTVPSTRIVLEVSGLSFFIEAEENHLGKALDLKYIEPRLKNCLADKGYGFSEDVSTADLYIQIKAVSRQGAEVYNLYSAFVDLTLSATNLSTGEEIYKNALNGIKGIQLDYDKAGIEALKNAGTKIEELVPDLLTKIVQ